MKTPARIRRHRTEWQAIIRDWQQSNQSAPDYCLCNQLSYGSFSHWRRHLAKDEGASQAANDFIDLTTLAPTADAGWNITLKLGDGVELVICR